MGEEISRHVPDKQQILICTEADSESYYQTKGKLNSGEMTGYRPLNNNSLYWVPDKKHQIICILIIKEIHI